MDTPVHIQHAPSHIVATYRNEKMVLPQAVQERIDRFWMAEVSRGKKLTRGPVFAVHQYEQMKDGTHIQLANTDYAHYLYTITNKDFVSSPYACRVVHTAALVQTLDHCFVIGEMASHNAHANRLQLVAGGLDTVDINDGHVDFKRSIVRELNEEVGISLSHIQRIESKYLKTGGDFGSIVLIFDVQLRTKANELQKQYHEYTFQLLKQGEKPEFSDLLTIQRESNVIKQFIHNDPRKKVDYLIPILEMATSPHSLI
ncbi:hypothetical protein [Marininema halotolerans]|uniref:Nudix hydrolase domain-containing protein n=1 Tax=Marininema halotolerans TaxID=1155944 RepID=A0A1I6SET9_9BACL|nr:hypothetical protein [Marininema halotolerans]SFS75444.1 hypothetical protein SAMN05444972_10730 [Marininema halotolerans]